MTVRIGSLFAGIGGFELGMEAALSSAGIPHRTAWQVEQDEYCQQVLARHWPEARRYSDVRDVGAHNLSPVDIVLGGFPCQDISVAGKGAGLEGERSGLFFEVVRICREMAPWIVCLENVSAIHHRGLDAVLWHLASSGYRVRYGNLRASDVGAPHRRERWFAVAWRVGLADPNGIGSGTGTWVSEIRRSSVSDTDRRGGGYEPLADPAGNGHRRAQRKPFENRQDRKSIQPQRSQDVCNPDRQGLAVGEDFTSNSRTKQPTTERADRDERQDWEAQPPIRRGPDGLPRQLDRHRWPAPPGPQHAWEPPRTRPRQRHDRQRLKALGNAIVPQCSRVIGDWIASNLLEEVTP